MAPVRLRICTWFSQYVFAFGPAGGLLLAARRAPAVPPFNNFFFNLRPATWMKLSSDQLADRDAIQRGIAERSCWRLREPPAVVAICDKADFSSGDGLADAREVCPELEVVRPPAFVEVGVWGCWHIHARADRVR